MAKKKPVMDKTPGIVSWNELVSTDVKGSKKFYQSLFGWKTKEMDMGGGCKYTIFSLANGQGVGGVMAPPPEVKGAPTMWMGYVTVTNLEAAVKKAKKLKAKICKDITDMGVGRFAVITDPQGGHIGLWQFK